MCYAKHYHIIVFRNVFSIGFYLDAVLFFSTIRVSPRIVYHYVSSEIFERAIDIDNLGIASVGAVFFKGEALKQDFAIFHWSALQTQAVDNLVSDISPHRIVSFAGFHH